MFGYMEGYSDTGNINYCPACGEHVSEYFSDGTAKCPECGMRFGVIDATEVEDGDDER